MAAFFLIDPSFACRYAHVGIDPCMYVQGLEEETNNVDNVEACHDGVGTYVVASQTKQIPYDNDNAQRPGPWAPSSPLTFA